jgi:hypothetical protein
LDGSTPALERERLINAFNADFSVKLFLVSTRAGVRKLSFYLRAHKLVLPQPGANLFLNFFKEGIFTFSPLYR